VKPGGPSELTRHGNHGASSFLHRDRRRSRAGRERLLLERIGNTPLLRLERVGSEFTNVEFCAKAEWFNPGGSVKDRPALSMIQAGLASGALRTGKPSSMRRAEYWHCVRDDRRGDGLSRKAVLAG